MVMKEAFKIFSYMLNLMLENGMFTFRWGTMVVNDISKTYGLDKNTFG
jgi:hypothetical protein